MATPSPAGVLPRWQAAGLACFRPGELEALKWAGLVCMVIDHVNVWFLGSDQEWMRHVGRVAFPLFALALGLGLARDPGNSFERAVWRLLPFMLAAQVGSYLVRDDGVLNILFVFFAASAWIEADWQGRAGKWVMRACALCLAAFAEFGLPGFLFVVCLWRLVLSQWRFPWHAVGAASGLALMAWQDASLGLLGAFAVVGGVYALRLELPRIRGFFVWFYVLQFPVALALVAWRNG